MRWRRQDVPRAILLSTTACRRACRPRSPRFENAVARRCCVAHSRSSLPRKRIACLNSFQDAQVISFTCLPELVGKSSNRSRAMANPVARGAARRPLSPGIEFAINGWNARRVVRTIAKLAEVAIHWNSIRGVRRVDFAHAFLERTAARLGAGGPRPPCCPLTIYNTRVARLHIAVIHLRLHMRVAKTTTITGILSDLSVAALGATTTTCSTTAPFLPIRPYAICRQARLDHTCCSLLHRALTPAICQLRLAQIHFSRSMLGARTALHGTRAPTSPRGVRADARIAVTQAATSNFVHHVR
mmetsp:Transcript_121730/g.191017  ORF Transcript_121730/g.191017 Transcript_121730/m.191017 type:complete len:300 (+) Transcript_121730:3719-4618(+)